MDFDWLLSSIDSERERQLAAERVQRDVFEFLGSDVRGKFFAASSLSEPWRVIEYDFSVDELLRAASSSWRIDISYEAVISCVESLPLTDDKNNLITDKLFAWLADNLDNTRESDQGGYCDRLAELLRERDE